MRKILINYIITKLYKMNMNVVYVLQCIYCSGTDVKTLTNDGGSEQQCNTCKKKYYAMIKKSK